MWYFGTIVLLIYVPSLSMALDETEILKYLKRTGYDSRVLPLGKDQNATMVFLGISLKRIVSLYEKEQYLLTNVWMHLSWTDTNLQWDPTKHNKTSNIHIPVHSIWRPDIRIYDTVDTTKNDQGHDSIAHVTHKGFVSNSYPLLLKTYCTIQVYYFPFDTQECNLTFASWSYDQTMVNLVPSSIHLAEYDANTAWKLVKTRMSISSDDHRGFGSVTFPVITFTLKLRRASDIVFYYLYLPILFFNIITIAQYLLPCDSTKKITICTTTFVGMTFFVLLLKSSLPVGRDVPSIVKYVAITLSLVGLSLLINVLLLSMHQRGPLEEICPLPHWARNVFLHQLAHLVGMRSYITPDDEHDAKVAKVCAARAVGPNTTALEPLMSAVPNAAPRDRYRGGSSFLVQQASNLKIKETELSVNKDVLLLRTSHTLNELEELWQKQEEQQEMHGEWEQMAVVLGRLVMFVYLIATSILWIVVFVIDQPNND
ncbi:Neuronal acetylcholine receptor subunit alpha-9 [Lamellibrachia satsuma]|nr:Neuronal acetylcholine receptor subunit alpha-9 [Lamellibrachia satsuma]